MTSIEERNLAYERKLKSQIAEIVGSVVGVKNARVQVNAELDFNRITQTTQTFDPNGQVLRSTQTREDKSNIARGGRKGAVSVGNQLPGTTAPNANARAGNQENRVRTEEINNFEISNTKKTQVTEAGRIKRLSVAVLVDGIYDKAADGKITYQPRPKAQLDQIARLVRTTIGFNQTRGDQVEIANLRFAPPVTVANLPEVEPGFLNLTKADYFYIAELAVLLLIALLALLFVVRPLIRRIVTPDNTEMVQLEAGPDGGVPQLTGPDGEQVGPEGGGATALPPPSPRENQTAAMMDVAQMAGAMHDASVQKVGEIVNNNPDEAVTLIRQWMQDPKTEGA